jgi:SAM-dependent methyltransferase
VLDDADRWNHNIHYQQLILDALPAGARRALDVGCGEGILTRALRRSVPEVVGIDLDEPSIALAREQDPAGEIDYVVGDALTYPFETTSFDVVASVTAIHHMDEAAALRRAAALARPGGVVAFVGVAARRWPHDLPWDAAGAIGTRLLKLTRREWTTPAPKIWPPPHTFAEMRQLAEEALPGVQFRRHVLWRWSLVWTKPPT